MRERLETEHLVLRKAAPGDLHSIWENVWKNERIAEMMLWQPTRTLEEAEDRLARTIAYQQAYHAWFICLKETDEAIGFAGVREDRPGTWGESGICLAEAHQNRGYGKEVLRALVELVFTELGGRRFLASCFHENARSAAVIRSLGFRFAGSREEERKWDGRRYLSDCYELLREEWAGA